MSTSHKEIYEKNNPQPTTSTQPFAKNIRDTRDKDKDRDVKEIKETRDVIYDKHKNKTINEKESTYTNETKRDLPFIINPISINTPYIPPQYQDKLSNLIQNANAPYIFKDYNINIGGPNANHTIASMIYEDVLPPSNIYSSYKTLNERNNLLNYVRGSFITNEEGEDIQFDGDKNSLNSRLKFLELNPFNANKYINNPYEGLPDKFLLYRSCYPIVYDKQTSCVQCQKNSVGMNIRIYGLTVNEFMAKHPDYTIEKEMNDGKMKLMSWNAFKNTGFPTSVEVKPDFKGDKKFLNDKIISNISDIKSIKMIYGMRGGRDEKEAENTNPNPNDNVLINNNNNLLNNTNAIDTTKNIDTIDDDINIYKFNLWREIAYYEYVRNNVCKTLVSPNFVQSYCYFVNNKSEIKFNKLKDRKLKILTNTDEIDKTIVLLTESPTYDLITWCTNSYTKVNNIQKQIYTGYKTKAVWESVIAQMLIVFCVMDKYNFTFENMAINKNFFIKDLNIVGETKNTWLYVINGIQYFIPNTGNLLLFDSSYDEINHFISKNIYGDDENIVKQSICKNIETCISDGLINNSNTVAPDYRIKEYISQLNGWIRTNKNNKNSNNNNNNILDFKSEDPNNNFVLFGLSKFLHDRTGTLLFDDEVKNIKQNSTSPFKRGEMIVYEELNDLFKFVIYYSNKDENTCYIVSKDDKNEIQIIEANKFNIFHYSIYETIKHETKTPDSSQMTDLILETYYI